MPSRMVARRAARHQPIGGSGGRTSVGMEADDVSREIVFPVDAGGLSL